MRNPVPWKEDHNSAGEGAAWLESRAMEKDLCVLVNRKVTKTQQCTLVAKRVQQKPELGHSQ